MTSAHLQRVFCSNVTAACLSTCGAPFGAGRHSSADQTLPNPSSPLKELSIKLSQWLQSSGLRASIAARITQHKPDCPLSDSQEQEALSIIINALGLNNRDSLTQVEPGQPLRLNLLQALAAHIGDKDRSQCLKQESSQVCASPYPPAFSGPKRRNRIKTSCLWRCAKATGLRPRPSRRWCKPS